jgi:hypothetical protein
VRHSHTPLEVNVSFDRTQLSKLIEERLRDERGLVGHGSYVLYDAKGFVKQRGVLVPSHGALREGDFRNLITDAGDQYYSQMGIALVQPANAAAPTKAIGMKLGTGTTAVAKNGAGAALVTYLSGSHLAFDATFPTAATKGAGAGWRITYKCTYAAGVATSNGISEAVVIAEATLTNATNAASATVSRALLSPVVNKAAGDTLTLTWQHDLLGA